MTTSRAQLATITAFEARQCLKGIGALLGSPLNDMHVGRPRLWLWPENEWPERLGISRQAAKNWLLLSKPWHSPLIPWLRVGARHAVHLDLAEWPGQSLFQRIAELFLQRSIILPPAPPVREIAEMVYPGNSRRALLRLAAGLSIAASTLRCHAVGVRRPGMAMAMIMRTLAVLADDLKMSHRPSGILIAEAISHEITRQKT
jgi:hypothetical protein